MVKFIRCCVAIPTSNARSCSLSYPREIDDINTIFPPCCVPAHRSNRLSRMAGLHDTTALYDRSSTGGLKEGVSTVAGVWFDHDAHESTEEFVR